MKMTTKEIFENNILEQYVLGELDAATADHVEKLRMSDNEIAKALDILEENFEKLALDNSITPPKSVKEGLFNRIKKDTVNTTDYKFWLRIAVGFAGLLFLGSVWMFTELNTLKEDLRVVGDKNEALQKDFDGLNKNYRETQNWYLAFTDPNIEQYILEGNALAPEAKILSYVNHKDKSVFINTKQLPELDKDHDYQMWADVDGEMIDMGVITKGESLMAMNYIENAESLNITIEPAGGNDHPTVERLISNVYLD